MILSRLDAHHVAQPTIAKHRREPETVMPTSKNNPMALSFLNPPAEM